jgi:hypothetical protein
MRVVKGCVEVFSKATSAKTDVTGEALYNKYKRLTGNAPQEENRSRRRVLECQILRP